MILPFTECGKSNPRTTSGNGKSSQTQYFSLTHISRTYALLSHPQLPLRVFIDRHYNKLIVLDICTLIEEIWSITVGICIVSNGLHPMEVMNGERNETIFIVNVQKFRFHVNRDTMYVR